VSQYGKAAAGCKVPGLKYPMMTDSNLNNFLLGKAFRNGQYPETEIRYRLKSNDLNQKYIVMVGDWCDLNDRTSTLHFLEATNENIVVINVYTNHVNFIAIADLIFYEN